MRKNLIILSYVHIILRTESCKDYLKGSKEEETEITKVKLRTESCKDYLKGSKEETK